MYAIRSYYAPQKDAGGVKEEFCGPLWGRHGSQLRSGNVGGNRRVVEGGGGDTIGAALAAVLPRRGEGQIHELEGSLAEVLGLQGRITSYNVCYTKLLRLINLISFFEKDFLDHAVFFCFDVGFHLHCFG